MKRLAVLVALLGLLAIAVPVTAQDFERHPHMLLHKVEIEDGHLTGFKKCVDLAGNRTVPLHAHHGHLHFGDSGVSFGGASGHAVLPAAPFPSPFFDPVPWSNCEEFATFLPLELPGD